jgi:hypothetical protein
MTNQELGKHIYMQSNYNRFVGIDNSHSGAIAIITEKGGVVAIVKMPVLEGEVDYKAVLAFLQNNGCFEHNTRVMLEEPYRFAKGINAVRIMWSCFHRLLVALEMSYLATDRIPPVTWQSKMLDVYGDKQSKKWAAKKVHELHGVTYAKTKKDQEGINDALLIAEFCRRQFLQ